MSTPSSCVQCSRPLTVESGSNLCQECARTANTPGSTSNAPLTPESSLGLFGPGRERLPNADTPTETTVTPPPRALLPASPAGYELLDRIGSGGMGAVYLARETAAERVVAMKFLHHPGRAGAFDRFLVELRAFARLDHPNIVRVFGSDFLRSDPYFTMEFAASGSLARRLEATGPLNPIEAARLTATIARAVHAAHSAGVVHRDLKPSNILLTAEGSPKVSDFGLAKRTDCDDGLTTSSGPLGTPGYMAPEQVRGSSENVGPPVDVYGLGATLYHLLTGRAPFRGPQPDILNEVLRRSPRRPRAIRSTIPAGLEAIVLKCLQKDPAARYPSAAALADDLDRFLAGLQPVAPELTLRRRAIQSFRRHRGGIIWVGAAMMAAVAFALALSVLLAPTPPDPAAEIIRDMQAGLTVSLLKDNRPRYARWLVGNGEVFPPGANVEEYAFHSLDRAYLELCPDPGVESYSFSAKLKHLGTVGIVPSNHDLGLFFCYETQPGMNQETVHTFKGVSYSDQPRPDEPVEKKLVVAFQMALIAAPFKHTRSPRTDTGEGQLDRIEKLPGPWREFNVEVSPQRIVVKCNGITISDSDRAGACRGPAPGFRKSFESYTGGLPCPTFPARSSLGVFVLGTGVAVKDAVLVPLK